MGVESAMDRAAVREREALRRRRLALLVEIEKLDRWIEVQKRPLKGGKRIVQGPKSGVRAVFQGGSPGSGKRA